MIPSAPYKQGRSKPVFRAFDRKGHRIKAPATIELVRGGDVIPFTFYDRRRHQLEFEEAAEDPTPDIVDLSQVDLKFPSLHVVAGVTNSGKTVALLNLIKLHAERFSAIFVFTGSIDSSDDYKDRLDKRMIFPVHQSTDARIRMIISLAKRLKKKGKQVLIVLDDCATKNFFNNPVFDELGSQSRRAGISLFILTQHINKLSPLLKQNCSYLWISKLSEQNLHSVSEYVDFNGGKKEFLTWMKGSMPQHMVLFDKTNAWERKSHQIVAIPPPPKMKIRFL